MSITKRSVVMRRIIVTAPLLSLCFQWVALTATAEVLTNESILTMLRWKTNPQEIIALIQKNDARFDFSSDGLAKLASAGISPEVLDAMWKATLKKSPRSVAGDEEAATSAVQCPSKGKIEPHSQDRLDKATNVDTTGTDRLCHDLKNNLTCPFDDSLKSKAKCRADLDWKTGSIAPSCVEKSGRYCFALQNVNNILYTYSFTVNQIEPQGSDLDLLKAAIAKLTDVFGGGGTAKKDEKVPGGTKRSPLCDELQKAIEEVRAASEVLQDAIAQLDPGKDQSGKTISVPFATTKSKWVSVPGKFAAFERAITKLIARLKAAAGSNCDECDLSQAEALVLDVYVTARDHYVQLCARANSPSVAYYVADLENTSAYNVDVTEFYGGQQTSAVAKTFHLDACRKILTGSAGFLLTTIEARSYVSRTVPDTNDLTKTQNVLGVDNGGRVRPALVALLNYNLPGQPWRHVGFAISAGPVFDISNGKADTSRFGFFGGGSLHLWNRLFLTPGVHVGEFADFPQGFNLGQMIPDNTGTPNPVKRYTARFAIGITFKVSELGFESKEAGSEAAKQISTSQPKSGSQ